MIFQDIMIFHDGENIGTKKYGIFCKKIWLYNTN